MGFSIQDLAPMPEAPGIRLLNDQVLIEPLKKFERFEDKTPSGLLWLPNNPVRDKSIEFLWLGRVILVGPGDKWRYRKNVSDTYTREAYIRRNGARWPIDLKPGDVVLYERRPWGD